MDTKMKSDPELQTFQNDFSYNFEPLPTREGISTPTPRHHGDVKAQVIHRSPLAIATSMILALLSFVFILATIITAALMGKEPSPFTYSVADALLLGPTIFPIAFAATCGHLMTSIAIYKSETGLELRVLEHLVGAQSIFSALERFVMARNFSTIGFVITLIWALSPLGGQALLRMRPSPGSRPLHGQYALCYLDKTSIAANVASVTSGTLDFENTEELYLAALGSSMSYKGDYSDMWKMPRIPSRSAIKLLSLDNSNVNSDSPVDTSQVDLEDWWSGLLGIPMKMSYELQSSIEKVTAYPTVWNFTMNTVDANVNCSSIVATTFSAFVDQLDEPLLGTPYFSNDSTIELDRTAKSLPHGTAFLYAANASYHNFSRGAVTGIDIYYGSQAGPASESDATTTTLPISLAQCMLSFRSLECSLSCSRQPYCVVERVKETPYKLTLNQLESLQAVLSNGAWTSLAPSRNSLSSSSATNDSSRKSSLTENFLYNPDGSFGRHIDYVNLSTITPQKLSYRLTTILNTFLYASSSLAWVESNGIWTCADWKRQKQAAENITDQMADIEAYYAINDVDKVWLGMAFVITSILFGMAVAGTFLTCRARVPDVFGYVSSLTLDNRYVETAGLMQSSALDGLERARVLGKVRFMLADVSADQEVGRIAFIPVSANDGDQDQAQDQSESLSLPISSSPSPSPVRLDGESIEMTRKSQAERSARSKDKKKAKTSAGLKAKISKARPGRLYN